MEYSMNELYHYGVKGMKWGVRRYQNKDGSLTDTGKRRETIRSEKNGNKTGTAKKAAALVGTALTVAAATALYASNPKVRSVVNKALNTAGKTTMSALNKGGSKVVKVGKAYTKQAIISAKQGVEEGIKEAPKKAAKVIVVGAGMNIAKRVLDKTVGKEEAARIFKANNGKKIDSFWKVGPDDRDDRDD